MRKKLRIRDRLLLGLAILGEEVIDVVRWGNFQVQHPYLAAWAPEKYKKINFSQTIWRLLRTEYIEKVMKDGKPYLRLTGKGKKFVRDFNFFKFRKKGWDGYWRLVIFDIPKKNNYQRDYLREKLKELGFGQLQQSVYISPYDFAQDMAEFLEAEGLLGKAFILVAKHQLMGDAWKLANIVWKLDKLNKRYQRLANKIYYFHQKKKKTLKVAKRLCQEYLSILREDPILPEKLLPPDWYEEECREELIKISKMRLGR